MSDDTVYCWVSFDLDAFPDVGSLYLSSLPDRTGAYAHRSDPYRVDGETDTGATKVQPLWGLKKGSTA
ncbi:MAG: hypothetical protein D6722_22220 [Bacteroidetes bacterium]|nr:MAG: hypothetical protein D6722_22220 [Bacteroidota bacterium]